MKLIPNPQGLLTKNPKKILERRNKQNDQKQHTCITKIENTQGTYDLLNKSLEIPYYFYENLKNLNWEKNPQNAKIWRNLVLVVALKIHQKMKKLY